MKGGRWNIRWALPALAIASTWVCGPALGDDAAKAPAIPAEVETKFDDLIQKVLTAKRKHWDADTKKEIDEVVKTTALNAEGVKALQAAANRAEDLSQEAFTARMKETLQQEYAQHPEQVVKGLEMAETQVDTMAATSDREFDYTRPLGQPQWKEALTHTLSPAQMETWNKTHVEVSDREIDDLLKPGTEQMRSYYERMILPKADEIANALSLPKNRADQLTALAKKASEASVERWRQRAEKVARAAAPEQRRENAKNRNYYGAMRQDDEPGQLPVWKDGLAAFLTAEEKSHLQTTLESRKTRHVHALGQLLLAIMDEKVAFTASQRVRLQPVAERVVQLEHGLFPANGGDPNPYYSFQLQTLYNAAAAAKPEELHPILDDLQWKHWQAISHDKNAGGDNDEDEGSSPKASPTPASLDKPSAPEPEAPEQAVADYLQAQANTCHKRFEAVMILKAEDANRVAGLAEPNAAHLQTAARGAAEMALRVWEPSMEQSVRAEVQGATAENIQQKLGNVRSYYYQQSDPRNEAIWKAAVSGELTPPQQAAWQVELDLRSHYNDDAIAEFLLAEFDRRFSLRPDQWEKIAPLLAKALQEYQPDIHSMFSYSDMAWYLTSYYMFLPLHAVPENDFKALLSHEQWDRWTGSREYSFSSSYWENIKRNHEQRTQQKQP